MNNYNLSKETSDSIGKIVGTAVGAIVTKLVIDWLNDKAKNTYHRHKRHR